MVPGAPGTAAGGGDVSAAWDALVWTALIAAFAWQLWLAGLVEPNGWPVYPVRR